MPGTMSITQGFNKPSCKPYGTVPVTVRTLLTQKKMPKPPRGPGESQQSRSRHDDRRQEQKDNLVGIVCSVFAGLFGKGSGIYVLSSQINWVCGVIIMEVL